MYLQHINEHLLELVVCSFRKDFRLFKLSPDDPNNVVFNPVIWSQHHVTQTVRQI